jgi:hypothetical protein
MGLVIRHRMYVQSNLTACCRLTSPAHTPSSRSSESSLQGRSCNVARSDALGKGYWRPRCLTTSSRCELQVHRVSIVVCRLLSTMSLFSLSASELPFLLRILLFVIAHLIDHVGSTRTDRAQEGVCPTSTLPFLHSCVPHSSCRSLFPQATEAAAPVSRVPAIRLRPSNSGIIQ